MSEQEQHPDGSEPSVDARAREWAHIFVELQTTVFAVDEEWQDDIEDAIDFDTETIRHGRLMAGETTVLVGLDGGVVFHTHEGFWSDESRAEAFQQWMAERDAAGEDWDEDDFDDEFEQEDSPDHLRDGVYVVGRTCARRLAGALGVTVPDEYATDDPASLVPMREPTENHAAWSALLLEMFDRPT